ncbi:MAG: flagellar basal body rod C-terminal domain-containing protein, partial [Thermodesulfobacteriota bacterium]
FFKMAGDDGFLYTRQGNFELDDQGNLVTADGRKQVVGANGPVNLPHSNVQIDAQGRISADGAQVGQISVYSVSDPKALSEKGDGLYALAPDAAAAPAPDAELVQGGIEHANVDPVLLTTEIIETKRAYAAYLKVMKAYSDMGEKAESLGRIG